MQLDQLLSLRDEISALILDKVDGEYDAERAATTMASKQLEQMTCMGGSTRALGESEIVRLVERFDDTRQSGLGPWPVSKFMLEKEGEHVAIKNALKMCIQAHKTGKFEPMMAAIEAAENLLNK